MAKVVVVFSVLNTEVDTEGENTNINPGASIFVDDVECKKGDDKTDFTAKAEISGISFETISSEIEAEVMEALKAGFKIVKDPKFITPFVASATKSLSSVLQVSAGNRAKIEFQGNKKGRSFRAVGILNSKGAIDSSSFTFLYK